MTIIFLSCCISALTLLILFFRRKNTVKIEIPTWFLGTEHRKNFTQQIIRTKPKTMSILLVICATILAGYIFFPRTETKNTLEQKKVLLLWVDPSLSSKLSRQQNLFAPQSQAKIIAELGYETYGLKQDFLIKDGIPLFENELIPLTGETSIANFLKEENNKLPSPFLQSLPQKKLEDLFQNKKEIENKKIALIAFSDGNEESLNGFLPLKKFIQEGTLIKSSLFYKSQLIKDEIIPSSFTTQFQLTAPPLLTDFVLYSDQEDKIPEYARPHLYKTSFENNTEHFSYVEQQQPQNYLPLLFACNASQGGFSELDPFSSIRELSHFFQSTLVDLDCNNSKLQNQLQFRQGALWLVPLTQSILYDLNIKKQFWIPQGFQVSTDSLIYVASSFDSTSDLKEKSQVIFEKETFPLFVNLAPFPPLQTLNFNKDGEKFSYSGQFKPIFESDNNIPLGWKSSTLPFFYLRTPPSSPNTELSRSHKWVQFWFQVAKSVKREQANFEKYETRDINQLEQDYLKENKLEKFLDPTTLNFKEAKRFSIGVFKQSNNHLVFIQPPFHSSFKSLTEDEFAEIFHREQTSQEKPNQQTSLSLVIAYVAFALSLITLWTIQRKEFP